MTNHDEISRRKAEFSRVLQVRMRQLNLTVGKMAEKSVQLQLEGKVAKGLFREQIYNYINMHNLPTQDKLQTLAAVLEMDPKDLLDVPYSRATKPPRVPHGATIEIKRTDGLKGAKVSIEAVMPFEAGLKVAQTMEDFFKKRGMTVQFRGRLLHDQSDTD